MDGSVSVIERALQLADAGTCRTMAQLRTALKREGYTAVEQSLSGRSIGAQLRARMKAKQAGGSDRPLA